MEAEAMNGRECGEAPVLLTGKPELRGDVQGAGDDSRGSVREPFAALGQELDSADWEFAPLSQLTLYMVNNYHLPCRHELQRTGQIFSRVSRALGDEVPQLRAAHQEFQRLRREVLTRLLREQQVIFPAIADRELGFEPQSELLKGDLNSLVDELLIELGAWRAALRSMHSVCQIGQEHSEMRSLCEGLKALEEILSYCLQYETDFLFPRALALKNNSQLCAPIA